MSIINPNNPTPQDALNAVYNVMFNNSATEFNNEIARWYKDTLDIVHPMYPLIAVGELAYTNESFTCGHRAKDRRVVSMGILINVKLHSADANRAALLKYSDIVFNLLRPNIYNVDGLFAGVLAMPLVVKTGTIAPTDAAGYIWGTRIEVEGVQYFTRTA